MKLQTLLIACAMVTAGFGCGGDPCEKLAAYNLKVACAKNPSACDAMRQETDAKIENYHKKMALARKRPETEIIVENAKAMCQTLYEAAQLSHEADKHIKAHKKLKQEMKELDRGSR